MAPPAPARPTVLIAWVAVRLADSERGRCAVCSETVICQPGDLGEAESIGAELVCRQCVVEHRIPLASRGVRHGG